MACSKELIFPLPGDLCCCSPDERKEREDRLTRDFIVAHFCAVGPKWPALWLELLELCIFILKQKPIEKTVVTSF